jgi:sulfatase modifying factor 1
MFFAFRTKTLAIALATGFVPFASANPILVTSKDMTQIPAGVYSPLFAASKKTPAIAVPAFFLDTLPVTNGDYLAFVRANPQWRRSHVSPLFADSSYLQVWASDLKLGSHAPADSPVVNVSWFAARAYARWLKKRLPTVAEWERVAAAGYTVADGKKDIKFQQDLSKWFAEIKPDIIPSVTHARPNYLGVRGLFGYEWEWVLDFNTALVNGSSDIDSRLVCSAGAVGAVDSTDYAAFMRTALRSSLKANNTTSSLGFRCAKDLPN